MNSKQPRKRRYQGGFSELTVVEVVVGTVRVVRETYVAAGEVMKHLQADEMRLAGTVAR